MVNLRPAISAVSALLTPIKNSLALSALSVSMLTTVRIPDGVDDAAVRKGLLNGFNLEIGGGLGPLKGKVWRIGLMGYSSTPENVLLVLASLEKMLASEGYKAEPGAGVKAAVDFLKNH